MSNILAVTSDRYAVLAPSPIATQSDNLTPLTVTFDAAAIALSGANPVFRIDWQLADGTELYSGNYPVAASTALTIPDSVLAQAGALQYQIRVSDDAGLVWHSIKGYTILPESIEAGTPATPDTRVYVESPLTFEAGNVPGYNPASGKMTDSGIALADVTASTESEAARILAEAARVSAEEGRDSAEGLRVSAEEGRVTAEGGRVLAEQGRDTDEGLRVGAEEDRATAEGLRAGAEEDRDNAEDARVIAEGIRDSAEDARLLSEQGRVTAEGLRVTAEGGRVSAEQGRVTAEQNRETIRTDTHEPTGFLDRVATLSWVDATRTLTITGSHSFYYRGTKFTKASGSKQISTDVGMHYLYYDATGTLVESFNTFPSTDVALVAFVYWNGSKGLVADERHGVAMDWATHLYLHQTVGTRYGSGLTGTFNDTTLSLTAGVIHDEDIEHAIDAATHCDVLYMDGSAVWTWLENQTKYYHDNGSLVYYNTGTALATVAANRYVAYWVFATNSLTRPIVALMGQRIDTTLAAAQANNKYESLSLGTLPFKEMKLLYRVILKGDKVWQETQDLRSVSNLPAGTYLATEHDALTGIKGGGTYHLNPAVSGLVAGDGAGNFAAATAAQIGAQAINDVGGYFATDTVDGALQSLGAFDANVGAVVFDSSYNTAWLTGTPSINPATGVITLVGHGLIANEPIEFDAGTGAIPTGISAYNSDTYGGTYYNVINVVGDTFQICATVGGASAVIPSDAGTSGWRIRRSIYTYGSFSKTDLTLDIGKEMDLILITQYAKCTTGTTSQYVRFTSSATAFEFCDKTAFKGHAGDSLIVLSQGARKYSKHVLAVTIRRIATDLYFYKVISVGSGTVDKSAFTTECNLNNSGYAIGSPSTIGLMISSNTYYVGETRSGLRLIVVRR